MMDAPSTRMAGRGRVIAFRIVAAIFGVVLIISNAAFGLTSLFDDTQKVHSFHNLAPFFIYTLLVAVPLIVLAIRPTDVVALRVAWAVMIGGVIASLMGEDLIAGSYFVGPVVLVILTVLAPMRGDLLRFGSPNTAMLSLSVIAAVAASLEAWAHALIMGDGEPAAE